MDLKQIQDRLGQGHPLDAITQPSLFASSHLVEVTFRSEANSSAGRLVIRLNLEALTFEVVSSGSVPQGGFHALANAFQRAQGFLLDLGFKES